MAPRKANTTVGTSTPITIGLALAILTSIAGFGWKAGAITRDVEGIVLRVENIERREERNSKTSIDLVTKLTRIETLLEGATAAIQRLEREKNR